MDQKNSDAHKKKQANLKNIPTRPKSQKPNEDNLANSQKDAGGFLNLINNINDDKPLTPKINPHTPVQNAKN